MNERLLRDGCEAVALLGGEAGAPSSQAVRFWLAFSERPTGRNWYRAHNASIVGGYLAHRELAEAENEPERFFMNVALARVLYAHALVGAPRLALGPLAPPGRVLGDPRLGLAGVFLSLHRVLPDRYPLDARRRGLPRRRAAARPPARLRRHRAAAAAAVRVVRAGPGRAGPAGAGPRRHPRLLVAVRAARGLAIRGAAPRRAPRRAGDARPLTTRVRISSSAGGAAAAARGARRACSPSPRDRARRGSSRPG